MFKKILIAAFCSVALLFGTGYWLKSLIPSAPDHQALAKTKPADIPYLQRGLATAKRGRILVVVSSTAILGKTGKKTGYEFTELARPYYIFSANGFTVDIASPQGGEPPAVIDRDDMGPFDYAFLNDVTAMEKLRNTTALADIEADKYRGIFFVGGKGAMFDFPGNSAIHHLVTSIQRNEGVIGAVCHGPAALTDITLDTGTPLLQGRKISSFTNEEELLLMPDAKEVFPFLLESRLRSNGADFEPGAPYLRQVSVDGRLITGQNPWSSWTVTEAMVTALGYEPLERARTPAEKTVDVLLAYENRDYAAARAQLEALMQEDKGNEEIIDRRLLAMHGLVAAMQWQPSKTLAIVRLLSRAKKLQAGRRI